MVTVATSTAQQKMQAMKGKNRRMANRYAVRMVMQYRAKNDEVQSNWRRGNTLDMSVGGILIDIPPVPIGSTVDLEIEWTGLYHGKMVRLVLTGTVVRIDNRGTAIRILQHQFRDVRPAVIPSRRPQRSLVVA